MVKYLLKRLLHGFLSLIAVTGIIMVLVYSLTDRTQIFNGDAQYTKTSLNERTSYMYKKWEEYGYLDYITYDDYLNQQVNEGKMTLEEANAVRTIGADKSGSNDSPAVAASIKSFEDYYTGKGYTVVRESTQYKPGTKQVLTKAILFVYKEKFVLTRLWSYFTGLFSVDNIYNASGIPDSERGLSFTWFDPAYNEPGTTTTFSPALMGNGTTYKYLFYFDNNFPFIHQNIIKIKLGTSYSVNAGVDIWETMTKTQGSMDYETVIFPTGVVEESAIDVHSATYVANSQQYYSALFNDDYTNTTYRLSGMSRMGYSFAIGIFAVILSYLLGIPLGVVMARHKEKAADKILTAYVIFIMAVPSLAYIFIFKGIGYSMGLPTTFDVTGGWLYYILPIVSLALPSVAGLMKWLRRYMIDQQNSDYVKFARSSGLSEGEIFRKHILKNAIIPIVHGIPGSVLGAITGAIITESVYVVPGIGKVLTDAIKVYDNGVIVGVAFFYAFLSIISIILGDIMMALVDPRISFSDGGR